MVPNPRHGGGACPHGKLDKLKLQYSTYIHIYHSYLMYKCQSSVKAFCPRIDIHACNHHMSRRTSTAPIGGSGPGGPSRSKRTLTNDWATLMGPRSHLFHSKRRRDMRRNQIFGGSHLRLRCDMKLECLPKHNPKNKQMKLIQSAPWSAKAEFHVANSGADIFCFGIPKVTPLMQAPRIVGQAAQEDYNHWT